MDFSDRHACHIGVRHVANLSPLLFAIFLNDRVGYLSQKFEGFNLTSAEIDKQVDSCNLEMFLKLYLLLYADDTVIFAESKEDLQLA